MAILADDGEHLEARLSSRLTAQPALDLNDGPQADIGILVHTHLHMDHAGQDYKAPNARILIQRKELQNAAAPDLYPRPFYDRVNVARLIDPLGSTRWGRRSTSSTATPTSPPVFAPSCSRGTPPRTR